LRKNESARRELREIRSLPFAEIKKLKINLNRHFDKTVIPELNSGQALTNPPAGGLNFAFWTLNFS